MRVVRGSTVGFFEADANSCDTVLTCLPVQLFFIFPRYGQNPGHHLVPKTCGSVGYGQSYVAVLLIFDG